MTTARIARAIFILWPALILLALYVLSLALRHLEPGCAPHGGGYSGCHIFGWDVSETLYGGFIIFGFFGLFIQLIWMLIAAVILKFVDQA